MFQAFFQAFCNHEIFIILNDIDTSSAGKTARIIARYFNFSVINWNLSHSNLLSAFRATNFLKWEIFSGSPGISNF